MNATTNASRCSFNVLDIVVDRYGDPGVEWMVIDLGWMDGEDAMRVIRLVNRRHCGTEMMSVLCSDWTLA